MLRTFVIATGLSTRLTLLALAVTIPLPAVTFAQSTVGAGSGHTLIVKSDGTVWSFGNNQDGQLGIGTDIQHRSAVQVTGVANIQAVAAGRFHSLALTSSGSVYAWGDNASGQVDGSPELERHSPVLLGLANVVAIAAGEFHSLALTANGSVYAWGQNSFGQIGTGTTSTSDVTSPTVVLTGASAIGAGHHHSLAVKTDGSAWAWGRNSFGQLGNGVTSTGATNAPAQMSNITTATKIDGGSYHSVILLGDGTLKAAGNNGVGQLGDATVTHRSTAVAVAALTSVAAITLGDNFSFALKGDGSVWAWGRGTELGQSGSADAHSPVQVSGLSNITGIDAGWNHSVAVTSTGVVLTWGTSNALGQQGDGTVVARSVATAISEAAYSWRAGTPVFSIASGTFNLDQTVIVTVDPLDATIHYTQNGSDPTEADPTVTTGGSIVVTTSQTLKAAAWKSGMSRSVVATATYTLKVATPTVSPTPTTYTAAQTVTMATTTPSATLRYTTDGTDPTASSTAYSGALTVANTTAFRIAGFKTGWTTSDLRIATYTMNFGTLASPAIDPAARLVKRRRDCRRRLA